MSLPPFFIFLVVHRCRCLHRRLHLCLHLHLPLPPPFKIVNPTQKTHATPAATPRELIPAPQTWKVIFVWLLSLLHPLHIQNLHSKRVKAFYITYLADPKRSVTTTPSPSKKEKKRDSSPYIRYLPQSLPLPVLLLLT
jgi:hypothetical protein